MPVTMTGPFFDGQLQRGIAAGIEDAKRDVAQVGVNEVHAALGQVLQNPTGFYESHVVTERARADWAVTDGGVVYGPWLAGTSSRNQTTRFKGYSHWRQAAQRLQRSAGDIASRAVHRRIGGMG